MTELIAVTCAIRVTLPPSSDSVPNRLNIFGWTPHLDELAELRISIILCRLRRYSLTSGPHIRLVSFFDLEGYFKLLSYFPGVF